MISALSFLALFRLIYSCTISGTGVQVNQMAAFEFSTVFPLSNRTFAVFYPDYSMNSTNGRIFDDTGQPQTNEFKGTNTSTTIYPSGTYLLGKLVLVSSNDSDIHFQLIDYSGTQIGNSVKVNISPSEKYARVVTLSNGNFVIIYVSNLYLAVYIAIYDSNGTAILPETPINNAIVVDDIAVTSLRGGGFAIAYAISPTNINILVCDNSGNKTVTDFQANAVSVVQNNFTIEGLSNGWFVFGYLDGSGNIRVKAYKPDGSIGFTELIFATSATSFPVISALDSGGFSVVYEKSSGVIFTLYDNNGTQMLGETIISLEELRMNTAGIFINSEKYVLTLYTSNSIKAIILTLSGCNLVDLNSIPQNITYTYPIINRIPIVIANTSNSTNLTNSTNSTLMNQTIESNTSLVGDIAGYSTLGIAGLGIGVSLLTNTNPTMIWFILGVLPQFYYLLFLDLDLPVHLRVFIEKFQYANLDFMPNFFIKYQVFDLPELTPPPRFEKYNFDALFFRTIIPLAELWIILAIFYIYLLINRRKTNWSSNLQHILTNSFPIRMWSHCIPYLTLLGYLQLNDPYFQDNNVSNEGKNLIITISGCVAIIFFILILISLVAYFVIMKKDENQSYQNRALFEDFDLKDYRNRFFVIWEILKRIAALLLIIFLFEKQTLQVLMSCLLYIVYFGMSFSFKPRKSRIQNITYIGADLLMMLVFISMTTYLYGLNSSLHEIGGYIIMGLMIFIIVFCTVPIFLTQWKLLKGICCHVPKKKYLLKQTKSHVKRIHGDLNTTQMETLVDNPSHLKTVEDDVKLQVIDLDTLRKTSISDDQGATVEELKPDSVVRDIGSENDQIEQTPEPDPVKAPIEKPEIVISEVNFVLPVLTSKYDIDIPEGLELQRDSSDSDIEIPEKLEMQRESSDCEIELPSKSLFLIPEESEQTPTSHKVEFEEPFNIPDYSSEKGSETQTDKSETLKRMVDENMFKFDIPLKYTPISRSDLRVLDKSEEINYYPFSPLIKLIPVEVEKPVKEEKPTPRFDAVSVIPSKKNDPEIIIEPSKVIRKIQKEKFFQSLLQRVDHNLRHKSKKEQKGTHPHHPKPQPVVAPSQPITSNKYLKFEPRSLEKSPKKKESVDLINPLQDNLDDK